MAPAHAANPNRTTILVDAFVSPSGELMQKSRSHATIDLGSCANVVVMEERDKVDFTDLVGERT